MSEHKKSLKEKTVKIASYVINCVAAVLLVAVFALALCVLTSRGKGYVNYFGYSYMVVITDSMEENEKATDYVTLGDNGKPINDRKLAFSSGEVILFDILSHEEKLNLKVGEVISFRQVINGFLEINTHRIVQVDVVDIGGGEYDVHVQTKGDGAESWDTQVKTSEDIIGRYSGSKGFAGKFLQFISSKNGFLIICVVPAILIVFYCLVLLVLSLMTISKEKAIAESEQMKTSFEAEKEKLRQELLAQMRTEIASENKNDKDGASK